MSRASRRFGIVALPTLALLCMSGCSWISLGGVGDYEKPTIAVTSFRNKAGGFGQWQIGEGMAEMLQSGLMRTGRFQVIERQELGAIISELDFQESGLVREEGRVERGRIKPVQYQIKGVVTDFSHVSSSKVGFFKNPWLVTFSRTAAVVAITVNVWDVESAELVASFTLEGTASAKGTSVAGEYKDVSFAGQVFFRTPLGRASQKVINRAAKKVADAVAKQPWRPRIAEVNEDEIVINGGLNHDIHDGQRFEARTLGRPVKDPSTGDILGRREGEVIGAIEVFRVEEKFALTRVIRGEDFQVGQRLFEVGAEGASAEGSPP